MTKKLNAEEFAAAMQAECERHDLAVQQIRDSEDVDARWARVHNPTHEATLCDHPRMAHDENGCSRCSCAYMPNGKTR